MRVTHKCVHVPLLRAELAAHRPGATDVAAVSKHLAAGVHEHKVAVARQLLRTQPARQRMRVQGCYWVTHAQASGTLSLRE